MRELLQRALTLPKVDDTRGTLPDLDDPKSPLYGQRHGGSFVTGAYDAAVSGFTYPGDVLPGQRHRADAPPDRHAA